LGVFGLRRKEGDGKKNKQGLKKSFLKKIKVLSFSRDEGMGTEFFFNHSKKTQQKKK